MQHVAEGMFHQPSEYMAMIWRIERNAYTKAPTLDAYLKMCEEEGMLGINTKKLDEEIDRIR